MFKLNPELLSLVAAKGVMFPVLSTTAAILKPYTPENNDNKVGAYCLCNGSTQTLSGLPRFAPGENGTGSVTIGELRNIGRIINDNAIGEARMQIGAQNYAIGIPDYEENTYTTYQAGAAPRRQKLVQRMRNAAKPLKAGSLVRCGMLA